MTNREQSYESFYNLGLTANYSSVERNNCKNAEKEFDAMQITNYIGRNLNITYTRNGTNLDILCLDSKPPLRSCDRMHNERNECNV